MMDTCMTCGEPLTESGVCVNVDCSTAQEQATRAAQRQTAKATAAAAQPSAWTSTGRVD